MDKMSQTNPGSNSSLNAQKHYNSKSSDTFYDKVWGGEDIHVGLYENPDEDIFTASRRTIKKMVQKLKAHNKSVGTSGLGKVLDLGSGFGGAARYLASNYECHVTCIDISEKENLKNKKRNKSLGLETSIDVYHGSFEDLPFEDNSFDVLWSEEAILHSDNKTKVFEEAYRVLKEGGQFIFTDPMKMDDCPDELIKPVLERLDLKSLYSVNQYKELAKKVGLKVVEIDEMPNQLVNHYRRVQEELRKQYDDLKKVCSIEYLEKMDKGLTHWVEAGKNRYLDWGILHFKK